MGITEEDMENLTNEMMSAFGGPEGLEELMGGGMDLSEGDSEDEEDEEAEEEIAVRRMEEPLPTKPLRKVKLDEVDVPELEPLPEDDAPLNAKPLAKSDPED